MRRISELLLLAFALTGTISIAASQVAMALGGAVALLDRGRKLAIHRVRTGLELPILAWAAACLLATIFASQPLASASKLKKLLLFGMILWPPAVLVRPWQLGRAFVMLLFAAGATSLYGVTTFLWQGGPELGAQIRGFHGFYLTNSGLLLLCTFPAIAFAACRPIPASYRAGSAIAAAAILTSQILGCLPGTWLGTAAGFATLTLRTRSVRIGGLFAALIVFVAAGPPVFRDRITEYLDPHGNYRLDIEPVWRNAARLIAEDPWTGWGLHDLGAEVDRVKDPDDPTAGHMKSVPWQIAASTGIPGVLACIALAAGAFAMLRRARRGASSPFTRAVVDGTEASFVGFLAAGLLEWNFGDSEILALLLFLFGCAVVAGGGAAVAAPARTESPRPA